MAKPKTKARPLSERAVMAMVKLREAPAGGYSAASLEWMLGWQLGTGAVACRELVAAGVATVRTSRVGAVEMFEVKR